VDTEGGYTVKLLGSGFGRESTDVSRVEIGGRLCSDHEVLSPTEIHCVAPAHTGRFQRVVVTSKLGVNATGDSIFGYTPPDIVRIAPSYALTGPRAYSFNVVGSNFGLARLETAPAVSIGGRDCTKVIHVNQSMIVCEDMDGSAGWTSDIVTVNVGGQVTDVLDLFVGHG